MREQTAAFLGTERFEVRRELGRGGFGLVYEVYDRHNDDVVALKTLRRRSTNDVQQLKSEFRRLADMRHENLVGLHELHCQDNTWFFTMDLVRGGSFLDWVWEPFEGDKPNCVRIDRARLAGALAQLVRGLEVLHASGHLHRDVKPSNVMVSHDGRVVLLDFGLSAMIGAQEGQFLGGTPGYAAPEASRPGALGPASDWYSVGAMLHEAVLGHVPRDPGTRVIGARDHIVVNAGEFEDIVALARALLAADPEQRRIDLSTVATGESTLASGIVGRQPELGVLETALDETMHGRAGVVVVHGPSGIGKTRLVREALARASTDALVFSGTCHERELIPFRAFDGVIDGVVQHLRVTSKASLELSPIQALALQRLFPAFDAIDAVRLRAAMVREIPDAPTQRRIAFAALSETLAKIVDRAPVVISIDDLQWGDSDSADLLFELLHDHRASRCLVIVTCRSEGVLPGMLPEWWLPVLASEHTTTIAVGPLNPHDTATLVRQAAGEQDARVEIERVIGESGGNPFFTLQLVRNAGAATNLDEILRGQLARLSRGARLLAESLAVVGRPLELEVAFALAARADATRGSIAELQRSRIATIREAGTHSLVELAHDRLRSAAITAIPPAGWAGAHRAVAEVLESLPHFTSDGGVLFGLFYEAGDRAKASVYAERAGNRAEQAFAFHQAADLYRKAADCEDGPTRRRALRLRLAIALSDAGSASAAAKIYDELAATPGALDTIAVRQRAMESHLVCGHIAEGLRALQALCEDVDLAFPPTPGRAFLASLRLMLAVRVRGVKVQSDAPPASRDETVRMDACFAAAKGLIGSDAMRGAYFAFRALELATRAHDAERTVRYLAFVGAAILAAAGGSLERWGKRMLGIAEREVARRGQPELLGTLYVCKGQIAILDGQWRDALEFSDHALAILVERCRNVAWEKNFCQMGALRALEELGEQNECIVRVDRFLRDAAQAGDVYARVTAYLWRGLNRIGLADVAGAHEDADAVVRAWSPVGYHVQHLYSMRIHVHADLYADKPAVAQARLDRDWKAIKSSFLTRVPTGRIDVALMRARIALATAAGSRTRRPDLLRTVAQTVRALRKESRPDAAAHASLLEAGANAVRGHADAALVNLDDARTRFAALSMRLLAACAEHRSGALLGGDRGAMLTARALATMAAQNIRDPAAWMRLCSPGFCG